jgi:hypothetical protein
MSALSPLARHEYYVELANAMPPPVLEQLEYRERRLKVAAETFEALRPGDAYEARLAVKVVACGAHAMDSLRMARVHRDDFAKMTRCRAQAASMMRAECAAKRALEREQKLRLAGQAVVDAAPLQPASAAALPQQAELQAAQAHVREAAVALPSDAVALPSDAVALPSDALASPPDALASPPDPVSTAVAPLHPAVAPAAAAHGAGGSEAPVSPEAIAAAEAFAAENIVAAAQIRQDGGITPQTRAYFRHMALPTDPAMIDALVRGTSDVLSVLDGVNSEPLDEAA